MKLALRILPLALALIPLSTLSSCEKGGAENAGEAVDEAIDDAGDAIEDAGDAVEDAVDGN